MCQVRKFALLVVAFSVALVATGQEPPRAPEAPAQSVEQPKPKAATKLTRAQQRKLHDAEVFVDRVVLRLHQTHDFDTIFTEFFVPDLVARHRAAGTLDGGTLAMFPVTDEVRHIMHDEDLRRTTVASVQVLWTGLVYYAATQDPDAQTAIQLDKVPEWVPKDVLQALQESSCLGEFADRPTRGPAESREEVEECIRGSWKVAGLLWREMPDLVFDTELYQKNVAKMARPSTILKDKHPAIGVDEPAESYVIHRDFLNFSIVQYQGGFRVLAVDVDLN